MLLIGDMSLPMLLLDIRYRIDLQMHKISVFGWPDPNTGFDQSEHALYTCYFIIDGVDALISISADP